MAYVADLHIHSRFSRACSQQLNIPNLVEWAKLKGINLLGTGDFLHPLWLTELKHQLKEDGSGFLKGKAESVKGEEVRFVLTVEIASMYSHGGRGRRIHNLVFMPGFEAAEKFQKALLARRATLASDGRPIVGIPSKELLQMALTADKKAIFIPAHCVLPDTQVHTVKGMQEIQSIKPGDLVYTHNNRKREVTEVIKHEHDGTLYKIQPWYFSPGLEATEEHPYYGFHIKYCPSTGSPCLPTEAHKRRCKHKFYEQYIPIWLPAQDLRDGDVLVFPRFTNTTPMPTLFLDKELAYQAVGELIKTGGSRGHIFNQQIQIDESFCRLIGYYLAEGSLSTTKGHISLAFNQSESVYIEDVKQLIEKVFGIKHIRIYRRLNNKGVEITIYSKLISELFAKLFYTDNSHKAFNKNLPDWMLHLPEFLQAQILLGWWRGDHGYTVSRSLMNQMKVICLRLGIVPSIGVDKSENHLKRGNHIYQDRIIKATSDLYYFSGLAFFEDKYNLLSDPVFEESKRKLTRRHGWIDKDYIYMPIRKITRRKYTGEVFNLEVDEDNSYITEFAAVHNCWTPWFGLFGSESGYDSLEECFEDLTDHVYGIETGLSSDPAMNWRIKELDNRSIISCSDAHSLPNLGREATVIEGEFSYNGLWKAVSNPSIILRPKAEESPTNVGSDIRQRSFAKAQDDNRIVGTIEFHPEEGKYHYTGHRNCGVKYDSEQEVANGVICPKCKRPLTVGVMSRVEKIAGRSVDEVGMLEDEQGIIKSKVFNRPGYRMLVPLLQIIAEALHSTPTSQKVLNEYKKLAINLGGEIKVLTKVDVSEIAKLSGPRITEGVERMRKGTIVIDPGYDGVYGVVKIWPDGESIEESSAEAPQLGLFD
ncbi:MAG: Mja hyp1 intein [Microgenomates group bacterium Gr01-1014_7]|nr:MAG: Mja hyp1 intein [Microgenomates group bacterium Gr01-1014_7]